MPRLKHINNNSSVIFITFSCYRRLAGFNNDSAKEIIINQINNARAKYSFKLLGYVIMPEHVHLVIFPTEVIPIGRVIGEIKSLTARKYFETKPDIPLGYKRVFWQRRCYSHNCRTIESARVKINYCHNNPVKRGLVNHPGEWMWSSYNWYSGRKDVPISIDEMEFVF